MEVLPGKVFGKGLEVIFRYKAVGQCVDAGYTDAVETSGDLVAVLAEFTAGMEHGKYDFKRRPVFFRVHSGRDASTVILDTDRIIFCYGDFDMVTVSGHGLVNTVVNDLIYKMMKTSHADVSNIH